MNHDLNRICKPPPLNNGWIEFICKFSQTSKFIYPNLESVTMPKKRLSLPKITKTFSSFLLEEEGKISKQSLLKLGAAVGGIYAVSGIANALHGQNVAHSQAIQGNFSANTITATHSHYDPAHSSHTSHGSHALHSLHSSHGSHGSHGSHALHSVHAQHTSHSVHSIHTSHSVHSNHSMLCARCTTY